MTGVLLETSELAYLLVSLGAQEVVGLEAPELFPKKEKDQEKTYSEGWAALQSNGWVKAVSPENNRYDFDPILMEIVAVLGSPEHIVATNRTGPKIDGSLLYYLAADQCVELAAQEQDKFGLGLIDGEAELVKRAVSFYGGANKTKAKAGLPLVDADKLLAAGKRKPTKKLISELADGGLDEAALENFEAAAATGIRGNIVVAGSVQGEVEVSSRAAVLGAGETCWLFHRVAETKEAAVLPFNEATLGKWLPAQLRDR